jgi:hypothetical protein
MIPASCTLRQRLGQMSENLLKLTIVLFEKKESEEKKSSLILQSKEKKHHQSDDANYIKNNRRLR